MCKKLFLPFLLILCTNCSKEDKVEIFDSNDLSGYSLSKEIAVTKLQKIKAHFQETNQTPLNELDENSIREIYRSNLEYMNKEMGLNLEYNETDVSLLFDLKNNTYKDVKKSIALSVNDDYIKSIELINEVYSPPFYASTNKSISKPPSNFDWRCGVALAGNFVATLGLIGCVTGVGCPLAIASKAIALAGVASCF